MFKIGMMSISDFSLADACLADLLRRVDAAVVRFDSAFSNLTGVKVLWASCNDVINKAQIPVTHIYSNLQWNRWNWRQELLNCVSELFNPMEIKSPVLILFPDADETFSNNFECDLNSFVDSPADVMMFDYKMIVNDKKMNVPKYPKARHCKVFKWDNNISFQPYCGFALPTYSWTNLYENDRDAVRVDEENERDLIPQLPENVGFFVSAINNGKDVLYSRRLVYYADTKIKHYCFYTKEMQRNKELHR